MIEIRPIQLEDYFSVYQIHTQAFDGLSEARLVELLHMRDKELVSLVAVLDGRVVGHVLFSAVSLEPDQPQLNAVGLAPVAVLPVVQKQGIGSQLIRAGLQACRAAGYAAVVVLGHPAYYPRFGFVRARDYGLDNEYGADEVFMVMELKRGVLQGIRGTVKYLPEFEETGC